MPETGPEPLWIRTAREPTRKDRILGFTTLFAAGNRVTVDRVGLSPQGVVFDTKGKTAFVSWAELVPSKMQYGQGYLILMAKEGTPPRGGAWVVDSAQGRAILSHPNWTDAAYARSVIPKWLT
ncbi:MAG: hypothetical protein L3K07_04110 [Thermoplasmata archaeon]|nr:hypothetical protein [Thermoplasmata archaeon]